jgi:hypothetical protein
VGKIDPKSLIDHQDKFTSSSSSHIRFAIQLFQISHIQGKLSPCYDQQYIVKLFQSSHIQGKLSLAMASCKKWKNIKPLQLRTFKEIIIAGSMSHTTIWFVLCCRGGSSWAIRSTNAYILFSNSSGSKCFQAVHLWVFRSFIFWIHNGCMVHYIKEKIQKWYKNKIVSIVTGQHLLSHVRNVFHVEQHSFSASKLYQGLRNHLR